MSCPLDTLNYTLLRLYFKSFLRLFYSLLLLYSFCVVFV
nr:MAG TPA: hypothetical protein [Bacteriophage sp.]